MFEFLQSASSLLDRFNNEPSECIQHFLLIPGLINESFTPGQSSDYLNENTFGVSLKNDCFISSFFLTNKTRFASSFVD